MISHVFLPAADFARAHAFWSAILPGLGWKIRFCQPEKPWAAWQPAHLDGPTGRPLLVYGAPFDGAPDPGNGHMLALLAPNRAAVGAAHAAALAHGASDEGAPGLRPQYHPDYFGAYFRDTEGNKACVVCHGPED
ncbi:glyoxalase [Novosphingobium sp. PC22D]|uniref:VOC family protein n=1 Tax=Novosphingobium sp. PC22D TaxID=1962403 RepID=UPI000BF0EDA0|nr:VOC family protein [Novosphingobium sp. PC22D]PEQ10689.1 glyoxalase [Novosphingobium sp. PC22D]